MAHIAVILKEGKDSSQCFSYRPIALLNADLKIFSKILATRLDEHIPSLIHQDQVGFTAGREGRENTQRVINAIYITQSQQKPLTLFSADAEKAFDRVDWIFLRATLQHIGLGDGMLRWFSNLYSVPSARVRVNDRLSDSFCIRNGMRQGCPLSPIIFILTLEPFLRKIRANSNIRGINTEREEHKLAAYADNLIFFITSPIISLPSLLMEIRQYGRIANYKVNYTKSEAMGMGMKAP